MSERKIPFTPWPESLAEKYRALGYWQDLLLTDLIASDEKSSRCALVCDERQFSYAELNRLSSHLARALAARGLQAGDTALVQLPNVAEFYLVFFALLKLGVAPVNALFNHQRLELCAYTQQLRPALLIASAEHPLFRDGKFVDELCGRHPQLQQVLVLGEANYADKLADLLFGDERSDEGELFAPMPSTGAESVAFFQLSGGSTGTPKLIPRTHNDYYYSVKRSAEICQLNPATRYLCVLPAAHNFPLSSPGALGVFYAGGCVLLGRSPEAIASFALIERYQVNMTALVPSAVALWLVAAERNPQQTRQQLASLQLLQVGGANFAEAQARRVKAELGCQLQQVFGMAEGLVNYTRLDDPDEIIYTTQGRPMSEADEVRLLTVEGQSVVLGEPGLLYTRGPYTFRGYFQAPEQNARVFDSQGFYCSGDLVVQDSTGNLRVVGRVKDQINRGGEKIAAEEIENLLLTHSAITQAALVAIADDALGEKSCACLVVNDIGLRPSQLRQFLRALGLADYKIPDRFQFYTDLPLTPVGKINKPALRRQLAEIYPEPSLI